MIGKLPFTSSQSLTNGIMEQRFCFARRVPLEYIFMLPAKQKFIS